MIEKSTVSNLCIGGQNVVDDQHNNIENEQDDILMDTTDMDEGNENNVDVTDEADPGLLTDMIVQFLP
jgi:hypothetical protein